MKITEFENRLKGHANVVKFKISAPFNLKTEINKLEGKNMIKSEKITWIKRATTIAAVVAICAVTFVSANSIRGFFKDITRWDGAIIGTEYVNATNDIKMIVSEVKDEQITLNINFENAKKAPFTVIQELAITEYKILDVNNKEILNVNLEIEDGLRSNVNIGEILAYIPINNKLNDNQNYKLVIETIYGLSKADQPLKITGNWECEFTR